MDIVLQHMKLELEVVCPGKNARFLLKRLQSFVGMAFDAGVDAALNENVRREPD